MTVELLSPTREGNFWVFADGSRLPVISGGSDDLPPAGDTGGVEPPAGDTGADSESGSTDPDPFDDESNETFSRSYVKALREKSARYREERNILREKYALVEPLFEAFGEHAPTIFQNQGQALADLFSADDEVRRGAAAYLGELAAKSAGAKREFKSLLEDIEEAIDQEEEDLERYLTPAEVQRIVQEQLEAREREQKEAATRAAQEENIRKVDELLESRGYGKKDGKPSPEALLILARVAGSGTVEGDPLEAVKEAIDAFEAERDEYLNAVREQAIAEFVEGRKRDASSNPKVPNDGVPASDAPKRPLDMTKEERIAWMRDRSSRQL